MRPLANMNISDLEQEAASVCKTLTALELQVGELRATFQALNAEIAKRKRPSPEPRLSDHALLRYLERVKGVDVQAARREIMTPSIITAIKAMATTVTVNGARFLVKDGAIVTIMEAEKKPRLRNHDREDRHESEEIPA
jgi:hypothetical protein